MNEPDGLSVDPLFVGLTRPAMKWGVTYTALLLNSVLAMELFLLSQNLLTLGIVLPIHGLCMLVCARDARYFELGILCLQTRIPALFQTLRWWHAASYSPLMLDLPDARDRRRARPWVFV